MSIFQPVASATLLLLATPSPQVRQVVRDFGRAARQGHDILIQGEPGSGKLTLASLINTHHHANEPAAVIIDCRKETFEGDYFSSQDFVSERRKTKFDRAIGGCLILTHIDALPLSSQVTLLEYMQGHAGTPTDVQLITTTSARLERLVEQERFDPGLHTYLSKNSFIMPPLRERPREISGLAQHFVAKHGYETGHPALSFTPAALNKLQNSIWPENLSSLNEIVCAAAQKAWDKGVATIELGDLELQAPPTPYERLRNLASGLMSPQQFLCFEATHLLPHNQKRSLQSLAQELECSERTISALIEAGKKILRTELETAHSDLAGHPIMRRRTYTAPDAQSSVPDLAAGERDAYHPASNRLTELSSILFNNEMHQALTRFYLATPAARKSGRAIGEILGLSTSGAHLAIKASRDILIEAIRLEPDHAELLTHPMVTGDDSLFIQRRFTGLINEDDLALDTVSAQMVFARATAVMGNHELKPFLDTYLSKADKKKPVAEIAQQMGREAKTVEEYILQGKTRLMADIEKHHPELVATPILRQRLYTRIDEYLKTREFLTGNPPADLGDEEALRMKWADVLLNPKDFHLVHWATPIPPRALERTFKATAGIEKLTTLPALYKTLQEFEARLAAAQLIEDSLTSSRGTVHAQGSQPQIILNG